MTNHKTRYMRKFSEFGPLAGDRPREIHSIFKYDPQFPLNCEVVMKIGLGGFQEFLGQLIVGFH